MRNLKQGSAVAVDVGDRTELQAWLEKQPHRVVVAFAVNAAFHVFPSQGWHEYEETPLNEFILPSFRALNQAWTISKYSDRKKELAQFIQSAVVGTQEAKASYPAYASAHAALVCAGAVAPAAYVSSAMVAIDCAAEAAGTTSVDDFIDSFFAETFAQKNQGMKQNQHDLDTWHELKNHLLFLSPNWRVWTDWYEARLDPENAKWPWSSPNKELELAMAKIPDEVWKQGWEVVNPYIEDLIEQHAPRPGGEPEELGEPEPQNELAPTFIANGDQPINVNERAGSNKLQKDEGARDRHGEALRLAQAFVNNFDRNERGANQATGLLEDIRLYIDAIGEEIEDIRPDLLVTRGDGLRMTAEAQKEKDDFSTLPEISDTHLLALKNLVNAHNAVVGLDQELSKRDNILLGPDAVENLVSPDSGQQALHDAVELGAATPAVKDQMQEIADLVSKQPVKDDRRSRRYSEGLKNFARVAIGKAKTYAQRAAWAGGGLYAAAQFVVDNETWLVKVFAGHSQMLDLIKKLLVILNKLPLL